MLKSMTGFGSNSLSKNDITVVTQVSSVNRSHLDIDISLGSKDHLYLLPDIRDIVKSVINRGKVNIYMHIESSSQKKNVIFNDDLAKTILNKVRTWEKKYIRKETLSSGDLLLTEGIISIKTIPQKASKVKEIAKSTLKKALVELDKMRSREGAQILKDFQNILLEMEKSITTVQKSAPQNEKIYEKKLGKRIRKSHKLKEISREEQGIMLKMVGLFTEKVDISEEISRLKSHISQFRHSMKKEKKPGKTLNFIAQEMLREANTMGSKSPSIDTKKQVIRIKTLIEEIKEQVSNVE